MLGDRDKLERMGEHARELFEARYSWARTADQTLDLYRRLMNGPLLDSGAR
jgi:glycosyltransferase involved in cell wall biosynthesis